MYDTMYNACGVSAAWGKAFIHNRHDTFSEDEDLESAEQNELKGLKNFINAKMLKEEEEWCFNEGCLSIPDVREDVYRNERITIEYCEEDFVVKTEVLRV
jgi:peptide deformylase